MERGDHGRANRPEAGHQRVPEESARMGPTLPVASRTSVVRSPRGWPPPPAQTARAAVATTHPGEVVMWGDDHDRPKTNDKWTPEKSDIAVDNGYFFTTEARRARPSGSTRSARRRRSRR